MARRARLRRRGWLTGAGSLLGALGALTAALLTAGQTRMAGLELDARLVPAARVAGDLLAEYTAEQNSLRDYVTSGQAGALAPYRQAAGRIPGTERELIGLVGPYPLLTREFASVVSAHRAWLSGVGAPQLSAAGGGDLARARALQNDIRPLVLGLRSQVADLQAGITAEQAAATERLRAGQRRLLAALVATVLLVVALIGLAVAAVSRWLLRPILALRRAADAVAGGAQDTPVPVVGPVELADLGRSMETMRTGLLRTQAERERLAEEAARERHERRLAQSQRLESLGQLVGGVAHDFNNLLGVILGYTGFVTEQLRVAAGADRQWHPVLADVQHIDEAAQRAVRLTHQLLAFGRREVTRPEVLNLNTVVGGLEPLLRRTLGEHIDLVVTLGPVLWPVKADPGQLEQVLVNLAVNARDAMPGGGKLSIHTDNSVVDDAYAADRPGLTPGRYARLRVSDTGSGMDRETLSRVFEPFFTTKPKGQGTGLGLATVYGIITQAGGYPQLYSEPGLGTAFTALLPVTGEAGAVPAGTAPAPPAEGRGETILVVEDEDALRDVIARILGRHGYHVSTVATAAAALAAAGDLDAPIDLLLTDVVMPTMLGSEVAAGLHLLRPGLPVLYMSGYAHEVLDAQATLDPEADLLEKPFTEDTLLARVRAALTRSDPPRA